MKKLINATMESLIFAVKRHPKVYAMARCFKERNSSELYDLLWGYYEGTGDNLAVIRERHPGEQYPDKVIYNICFDDGQFARFAGFFAILRVQLGSLAYAEHFGFSPSVYWGPGIRYYDTTLEEKTHNAYEYYFEPIGGLTPHDIEQCRNVVDATERHSYFVGFPRVYHLEESDIQILGKAYRKYIHLNNETSAYLKEQICPILKGKRTLGVHARGTDFNQCFKGHPNPVSPQEYVDKARELFSAGMYDQIFLATEDQNILELFKKTFGDRIVYYDVARSSSDVGPHMLNQPRPLHRYKLGLEVLRDVYTLACCDSLISGLSQVSFSARYINYALDKKYDHLVVMDNGINTVGRSIINQRSDTRNNQ